jgi:hypothetical protein
VCPKLKVKLVSKLADLMDDAEADVLAYMGFPAQHRAKIHSTNPLERLNSLPRTWSGGEIKRRSEVVGIFPNEAAVARLIGALLLEQNDEWAVQRARYMTLETIAPLSDDKTIMLPIAAAWHGSKTRRKAPLLHQVPGHDRALDLLARRPSWLASQVDDRCSGRLLDIDPLGKQDPAEDPDDIEIPPTPGAGDLPV